MSPLLIFNGIGANLELVMPFVKALDPDLEVIAFDVPGVGGSSTPSTPYRFPGLAKLAARKAEREAKTGTAPRQAEDVPKI